MSEIKNTYEVLRPIGWLGTRFERGAKIELTEYEASAFSSEEIKPAETGVLISEKPDTTPVTTGEKVEVEAAVKPKRTRKAKKK